MPQADRAFISIARHRGIRAAALLWIWLTVVFAPVGATLHAMSHLELPPTRAAVPAGRLDADQETRAAFATEDRNSHGAAEHCHDCDEWQFLNHVLTSTTLADAAAPPAVSPASLLPAVRLGTETPWILPRAPPAPQPSLYARC